MLRRVIHEGTSYRLDKDMYGRWFVKEGEAWSNPLPDDYIPSNWEWILRLDSSR